LQLGKWLVWSSENGLESGFGTKEKAIETYNKNAEESDKVLLLKVQECYESTRN